MMTSKITVLRLLQQLLKKMARQDKSFDHYHVSFLKKLHSSPSEKMTDTLYEECTERLNALNIPIEDTLSEGRLIVSQSQLQLQRLTQLSDPLRNKIEQSMSTPQPYSIIEYHNEITNIIKIYQRAVIELNNNKVATADDINEMHPFDELCDELQLLILNLDIGEAYIKQLEAIRHKIVSANSSLMLPQYCMSIIAIIIDSTREERRSSRHFLYTLNDSLTQFYLDFSSNIKYAESTFEKQEQCIKTIQRKSSRLKKDAEEASNIELLRNHIYSYSESVEQLIKAKVGEKEDKVRQQFQGMVRKIKELQNETQNYQNTLKQQNKQLHTDFLTKIPNRAAWSERLEIEFTRYQRYQHPLNLAIIDIDKFKKINDTFGHLAGDKVLNVIAQTLQKSLRNADFIARYGGEEFSVLLPDITPEQMQIVLDKLCKIIKAIPFKFKKDNISITISIGCCSFAKDDDINSAFERADQALYYAKNNGRDHVIYFKK
ncbi:GGDEF domain-containing protein [Psychromonas antarctica]|uniref:GGDEF domain-containing protein n=1 Tax=Psychromonas antarctica TaxID=67573 RepID=UPI001EE7C421|nr:GGDEF domain-containing protein [Psychromonas antarctica]MCG6201264.1 GGDEF domain-containing protein [Psychromonas antarctica]